MRDLLEEIKVLEPHINKLFDGYLARLEQSTAYLRNELPKETAGMKGIYVFYDQQNTPLYVGRTDNIRSRIHYHTRQGSGSGSATYAFNRSKTAFEKDNELHKTTTRLALEKDPKFVPLFLKEKEFLYNCSIRFLELENDVLQAMIEPYIAVKLGTYPVNQRFENH